MKGKRGGRILGFSLERMKKEISGTKRIKNGVHPKMQDLIARKCWGIVTLPETNRAPEKRPSQKETHLPTSNFQVLC